ncbi:MAG: sugar phosphate isomerase/epimerase family protein [Promethearchaeota archaeon]
MLKLALNQATCKELSFKSFLECSMGFQGVELDTSKIEEFIKEPLEIWDLKELLETYSLEVESVYGLDDFSLNSERDYKIKTLPAFHRMLKQAYKLESDLLIVTPSDLEENQKQETIPQWRILRRTKKRLEQLSKRAYGDGINICFHYISLKNNSLPNLHDVLEIIEELEDRENIGLLLDNFHLVRSGVQYSQLKSVQEQLFLFRISDFEFEGINGSDSPEFPDKTLPGRGDFNFKDFFRWTRKLEYRKTYSLNPSEGECNDKIFKKCYKNLYPLFRASEDLT